MDVKMNDYGVMIRKTESDKTEVSWFDSIENGVVLIRYGVAVMIVFRGEDYEANYAIACHLDDMWEDTKVGQLLFIDWENEKLMIIEPNDLFSVKPESVPEQVSTETHD